MGRLPKIQIDRKKTHMSKKQLELREQLTPKCLLKDLNPPPNLNEKELEVWNWLIEIIKNTENCQVSDADRHLMELYCRAKVAFDEADEALKLDPSPYINWNTGVIGKDGLPKIQVKPNPNIKKRNDNLALCIKLFDHLGLSPVARAKVGGAAAEAQYEAIFSDILNRSDD